MAHAQQLFVGRLPIGTRSEDLDKIFRRYGRMTRCDVKQGLKMAYGFIEFEDKRDAEEAMECEQGTEIRGARIVVEWSRGFKDKGGHNDYHGRGRDRDNDRDYRRDRSPPRYDKYRERSPDNYRDRSPDRYSSRGNRDRSPDHYRSSSRRSRSRSHERY